MNPFFYVAASFMIGSRLRKIGRKCAFTLGLLLIVCQLFTLALLEHVNHVGMFVSCAMVAQALGGLGAGTNTTACFSLVTTFFADDKQRLIGYLECGIGLGLLVGPILGALLYSIGGYSCPFWTLGITFLLLIPLLRKVLDPLEGDESDL